MTATNTPAKSPIAGIAGELLSGAAGLVKLIVNDKANGGNILQQIEQAAIAIASGSPASIEQSFSQGPEDILGHNYEIVETVKIEFKPTS